MQKKVIKEGNVGKEYDPFCQYVCDLYIRVLNLYRPNAFS